MKIILNNGTELEIDSVFSSTIYIQGVQRSCLSIYIEPDMYALEDLDKVFTPNNCSTIKLVDDNGEYIHQDYTIRVSLEKGLKEHISAIAGYGGVISTSGDVNESQMVKITLAQLNYIEKQLMITQSLVDQLLAERNKEE